MEDCWNYAWTSHNSVGFFFIFQQSGSEATARKNIFSWKMSEMKRWSFPSSQKKHLEVCSVKLFSATVYFTSLRCKKSERMNKFVDESQMEIIFQTFSQTNDALDASKWTLKRTFFHHVQLDAERLCCIEACQVSSTGAFRETSQVWLLMKFLLSKGIINVQTRGASASWENLQSVKNIFCAFKRWVVLKRVPVGVEDTYDFKMLRF